MTWETTADTLPREPLTERANLPAGGLVRPVTDIPNGSGAGARGSGLPASLWTEELGWDDRRVLVVEPSGMRALGTAAAMEGYLWVAIEPPRPSHRGKLALHIEECIESALQARGAPFPGVGASTDLDASLGDQLYRARLVEMRGIALGIPNLGGIVNLGGVLDAEDSAALRWWAGAAMDRPVRVVLSAENRVFRIYTSPVPFGTLLDGLKSSFTDSPSPRAPSTEMAQSVAAMELSDLPPGVAPVEEDRVFSLGADVALPELDRALGLEPEPIAPDEPVSTETGQTELESAAACPPDQPASEDRSAGKELAVEPTEPVVQTVETAPHERKAVASEAAEVGTAEPAGNVPGIDSSREAEGGDAVQDDDGDDPVMLAALSSPAAPEVEAPRPEGVLKPIIKSAITPPLERRRLAAKAPFIVAAQDDDLAGESTEAAGSGTAVAAVAHDQPTRDAADGPGAEQSGAEQSSAEQSGAEQSGAEQSGAEQSGAEQSGAEQSSAEAVETVGPPHVAARRESETAAQVTPEEPSEQADEQRPFTSTVASPAAPNDEVRFDEAVSAGEGTGEKAPNGGMDSEQADDRFVAYARENWKSWVRELDAARGPKPLAVIERLFVSAYTRLDAAVQRGIGDERAVAALEQWRASFSKSYTEAFDALRLRGKRPTMVLDVPELAQRIGRLHGARRVQLVLVDGMRFDLGVMVQDRLKHRAEATLAERLLLWSALPTTTTNQLELIGKGPDGLKEMAPGEEASAVVARGRAAQSMRRIRTGRRELLKLDLVEAALREGLDDRDLESLRERLTTVADEVASVLLECMSKQPPRTLVVVFGDHGFRLHGEGGAGRLVSQGGASPEEVLVPAFAWLTGAVH